MGLDLVLLASGTSLDVIHNPSIHLWPLIEFFDFSNCFILSRVSGGGMVMSFFQDVSQELF